MYRPGRFYQSRTVYLYLYLYLYLCDEDVVVPLLLVLQDGPPYVPRDIGRLREFLCRRSGGGYGDDYNRRYRVPLNLGEQRGVTSSLFDPTGQVDSVQPHPLIPLS